LTFGSNSATVFDLAFDLIKCFSALAVTTAAQVFKKKEQVGRRDSAVSPDAFPGVAGETPTPQER
jgi:hypothetical protein